MALTKLKNITQINHIQRTCGLHWIEKKKKHQLMLSLQGRTVRFVRGGILCTEKNSHPPPSQSNFMQHLSFSSFGLQKSQYSTPKTRDIKSQNFKLDCEYTTNFPLLDNLIFVLIFFIKKRKKGFSDQQLNCLLRGKKGEGGLLPPSQFKKIVNFFGAEFKF